MPAREIWPIPVIVLGAVFSLVQSRFDIETGGLKIKLPTDAAAQHQAGFEIALANFGSPRYGGELVARLVYVDEAHGHGNTCVPSCKFACQNFTEAKPPFKLQRAPQGQLTNYILVVDRGPQDSDVFEACKFADKVINAQQAGAQGVLVVNYEDRLTTMEAPDQQDESPSSYARDISIPAAFIRKTDGDVLKQLLQPSVSGGQDEVYVIFDWNDVLPRQEKVAWEFWTNSNDQCGAVCNTQKEFIKEFVPAAKELEQNHWTSFTPHFILWICPVSYRSTPECQSQCIHQGRYCTPDPDGDLEAGYTGKEIVQENLRQLCVYKLGNESGRPWVWWEYVTLFGEQCTMKTSDYGTDCAMRVFDSINSDGWSSRQKLEACIGDIDADTSNAIFEEEMLKQQGDADTGEVYILPTIRINNRQYRGKLAYTEVLKAICAGFSQGSEPPVCLRVSEDSCRPGSVGEATCSRNTMNGRTQCMNTFAGFSCSCGPGWMVSGNKDAEGNDVCININECVTASGSQLRKECTCERCACQDTLGGYECHADLPDECASSDNGGCWQGDFTVNGNSQHFSACQDNIKAYKEALAWGRNAPPLHSCACPPCFQATATGGCEPKCELDTCNLKNGACNSVSPSSGTPSWAVLLIVVGALSVVGAAGYALYRLRIRAAMHKEIRDIMAQYMPLESNEGAQREQGARDTNGHAQAEPSTP